MPDQVLFSEQYGNENENIFIKSKDELSLIKLQTNRSIQKSLSGSITLLFKDVFLPQGFPDSVHPDYIPYQIWDTIQAFASTIMGTLTTHSIMQGVGVGESSATPLAAAITWILKDGTGMAGRIIFAWWNGTDLDGQCKKWRLFADILNDIAMGIELLIPYFSAYSMSVLCISTAMKSVVGVAGGATRAALTQHQALQNNLADVAAKDGSQETCVNLIASFIGIFILSCIHDGQHLLQLYLFLVAVHLYANYSAVKALCMNTLNEDRFALLIKNYLIYNDTPGMAEINKKESVILFGTPAKHICGFHIELGVSIMSIVRNNIISSNEIETLLKQFHNRKYIIVIDMQKRTILVPLRKNIEPCDILEAYFHAYLCGIFICISQKLPIDLLVKAETYKPSYPLMRLYLFYKKYNSFNDKIYSSIVTDSTFNIITKEYQYFIRNLQDKGWIVTTNLLPVNSWRYSYSMMQR